MNGTGALILPARFDPAHPNLVFNDTSKPSGVRLFELEAGVVALGRRGELRRRS